MTRSLLAHCPGYPITTESLMPRRLLGELATALHDAGGEVGIVDGGTLYTLADAYGPHCPSALTESEAAGGNGWRARRTRARAKEALWRGLARHVERIAQEAARWRPFALAVVEVARSADVPSSLALAARIRALVPEAVLLAAGQWAQWHAHVLLGGDSCFDAACRGDVEEVAPAVAACLDSSRDWRPLPGLQYRAAGGRIIVTGSAPLNPAEAWSAPLYDRAVYPAVHGPDKLRVFPIAESRGGDLGGHAYPQAPIEYRQVRVRPAEMVCGEVADHARALGARAFHFTGAGTPAAQLDALAYELLARCLHIRYSRIGHVRNLDPLTVAAWRTSGCQALELRVDSGSQRLLSDYYGHRFGVSETVQLVRACNRAGLFVQMHFTYPCPADDYHTRAESLRLARHAGPASVTVGLPELLPDSAWHKHARAFGFRVPSRCDPRGAAACDMRGWSAAAVARAHEEFREELTADGQTLDAGAVEALLGRMAAGSGAEVDFALRWRRALRCLDTDTLGGLMAEFNACAVQPMNTVAFPGPVSIRAVVGN